jgi:DNA-binding response OmpR family regulator
LEKRLLGFFSMNAGKALTFDEIIGHVWGARGADRDMLRQLIHRLRIKVEPNPARPTQIKTLPGLGYILVDSEAASQVLARS